MKFDLGMVWGRFLNWWNQIGVILSMITAIMTMGNFYVLVVIHYHLPLYGYILIVAAGVAVCSLFILKLGISGNFRYMAQQMKIEENNRMLKKICERMGINVEDGIK
jgi:hypothetical protein